MLSRRSLLAVIAVLALFAVPSAAGVAVDGYTATGTPSHLKPSTATPFEIGLTNKTGSPKPADRAKIGIPAGFVVAPETVRATTTAAAGCVGSTWVADGSLILDGKLHLRRPGGAANNLCPGATLTVAFSATASGPDQTDQWATELFSDVDTFTLTGSQPPVAVDGTAPIAQIDSNPPDPSDDASPSFAFSASEPATFECKLDAAAFQACASPKSYAVSDGTHTFAVRAIDLAGNRGSADSYSWLVETDQPVVELTNTPKSLSNDSAASFVFSAEPPATRFDCRLDSEPYAECSSPKNYAGLADGPHTFAVRGTGTAGTGPETTYSWTIDTVAPAVALTDKPADPSSDTSPTFGFSASEPATLECKLDTGAFEACTSPKTYDVLSGEHTFAVRAIDLAGNVGSVVGYSWLVETVKPVVELNNRPSSLSNSSAASFVFTANKPATFECKLDDGPYAACSSPKSYTGLANGPHTFRVKATGTAGTGPETEHRWTIDTVAPGVAITAKPADPTNSRSALVGFATSEPASFQCKLDDGAFASCVSPQAYTSLGDGRHAIVVRATDAASNVGEVAYAWTIETRPPALSLPSSPPGLSNSALASFSFAADEPASFQCNLDDRGFEPCGSPASYAGLRDGGHAFAVRAIDIAGNVAAASHAWTIDTTPPQTNVDARPPARTTARSARFVFSANEPVTFECRLDSRPFSPCRSPQTYARLSAGVHRFEVRALDAAGNADATPPGSRWTIGRAARRAAAAAALFAPIDRARVTRPPLLRWRAVSGASYYNVQLYRAGRKVLSAWPTRTRLQLRSRWTFNGRVESLKPGLYRWYAWPGHGRAADRRYGRLLGASTFVFVAGSTGRR